MSDNDWLIDAGFTFVPGLVTELPKSFENPYDTKRYGSLRAKVIHERLNRPDGKGRPPKRRTNPVTGEAQKYCCGCKKWLPVRDNFGVDMNRIDEVSNKCKACVNKYNRSRKEAKR